MRSKIVPLSVFTVKVWTSSLYFHVYVWRTKKDFLAARYARELKGVCVAYTYMYNARYIKNNHRVPIVGEIHFYRHTLLADRAVEAIAHESFHATIGVLRRVRASLSKWIPNEKNSSEEIAAQINGELNKWIFTKLMRRGLISALVMPDELQTKKTTRVSEARPVFTVSTNAVSRCRSNACRRRRNRTSRKRK